MKQLFYLPLCALLVFSHCSSPPAADKSTREIHNKEFNWTISIPENFESVGAEEWSKMQNEGADLIEDTYNEKVETRPTTIFVFKADQLNFFESNYQPYDPAVDGDYAASCKNVNDMMYATFEAQMPGVKIDTAVTTEKIGGLDFRCMKMKVNPPNSIIMHIYSYGRLFDKKEFTVNMMYVDEQKGQKMLDAWTHSKFEK